MGDGRLTLPLRVPPGHSRENEVEGAQGYGDVVSRATGVLFSCDMAASM
jgi:hypothetical protein